MTARRTAWTNGCLVVAGVSHHTASVELRERLSFDQAAWRARLAPGMATVLLTTCNRTEAYAWGGGKGARVAAQLVRLLAGGAGVDHGALAPHLFVKTGLEALNHLVRVVSGLDSLVLGEEQIRGQVREAHRLAQRAGGLPAPLDGVFHRALEAGRRVRGGTGLGHQPSVAAAAVEVGRRVPALAAYGLAGHSALVLGAGAMAKSAARALIAADARVTLLNRTPAHANRLAQELGRDARSAALDQLPTLLLEAVMVVGATASRRPVLDAATVGGALSARNGRPLVVLDVAIPRDVDPAVRSLPGVHLLDLDDLEGYCPVDATTRHAEVTRAEALAAEQAQEIARWLRVRAMSPAIVALRRHGDEIRSLELRRAGQQLADLTPLQQAAVDQVTRAIVRKLLHGPTVALREAAATGGPARSTAVLDVLRLDRARHRAGMEPPA